MILTALPTGSFGDKTIIYDMYLIRGSHRGHTQASPTFSCLHTNFKLDTFSRQKFFIVSRQNFLFRAKYLIPAKKFCIKGQRKVQVLSGILRDKTMDDELMYILNYDKQITLITKLLVEKVWTLLV